MFLPEEIEERKAAFAAALLRFPNAIDAGKAAASVESRPAHAHYMVTNWTIDPEVMGMVAKLRAGKGSAGYVPTKEEFAAALWLEANGCEHKDTKLKFFELFAKTMSFIEKPPSTVVNNNNAIVDARKVMIMPAPMSIDEWEAAAVEQQAKLVNAAS